MEREFAREGGFRRRPLLAMIGLAAVLSSFLLYDLLQSGGKSSDLPRAATSKSVSALGFSAFAELLDRLGYTTKHSRTRESRRSYKGKIAVLSGFKTNVELEGALKRFRLAKAILIIAPKRAAKDSLAPHRYVARTAPLEATDIEIILRGADSKIRLQLGTILGAFATTPLTAGVTIDKPQLADRSSGPALISYVDPQAIHSGAQALLIELRKSNPRTLLLTDPDPLSNHGIGAGENALFAVELISYLGGASAHIVFDEALAGSATAPSPFAKLFETPWLALSLAFVALALVIGIAALARFGTPKESPVGIAAGRASLIGATARLNVFEDGGRAALVRYMRHAIRDAAAGRRAPGMDEAARLRWLDKQPGALIKGRHLQDTAVALAASNASETTDILKQAQRIHDWRTEMLNERH